MEPLPSLPLDSLRRLARGLLYDEQRAEDVVQEAWLAALEKRPPAESLAGWMRTAVRHLALNVRRESERRGAREASVARPTLQPDGNEVLAQVEILQRVLDALASLDEPYRTAVGLRYLEDLPPRTIAKKLGLPVNTVRTHVRRGLAELRQRLERGTRREDLLAALAPLAGRRPWSLAPRELALATTTTLTATVAALWIFLPGREPSRSTTAAASALTQAPDPARGVATQAESTREPLGSSAAVEATWMVRGRVSRGSYGTGAALPLHGRLYAGYRRDAPLALEASFASGADGRFEWELETPATSVRVEVEVVHPDHSVAQASALVPHGEFAPELFVRAYPLDATIAGVLRTPSGTPAAGGRVVLADQTAVSGADGRFGVRTSSELGPQTLWATCRELGAVQLELAPFAAGEARALDVTLGEERIYRGTIIDEQGAPLEGVEVSSLWVGMLDPASGITHSDSTGRYELRLDDSQPWAEIQATMLGFAPQERTPRMGNPFEAAPLLNEGVDFRLARGTTVSGRVLTAARMPLPGAAVYLSGSGATHMTESAADGRFVLEHVPVDEFELRAVRAGFAWSRQKLTGNNAEVTLTLSALEEVVGRVVDPDGNGVPFAKIMAASTTFADENGDFTAQLEPGRRTLELEAPGWTSLEASPDASPFVLRPRGVFAGRVLDATTGTPIPSFTLAFFDPEDTGDRPAALPALWRDGVQCASPDGTWRLAAKFPIDLELAVEVRAPGYVPTQDLELVSTRSAEPDGCVLALYRTTVVRGEVVSAETDLPISGVEVFRTTSATRRGSVDGSSHTMTDEQGRFELRDVPAGPCHLGVRKVFHQGAKIDGPFEVGAEPVERRIRLPVGATLAARLLDEQGRPLADRDLQVRGVELGSPMHWIGRTDSTGAFEFRGLPDSDLSVGWYLWASEASPSSAARGPVSLRDWSVGRRVETRDLVEPLTLASGERRELVLRPLGSARVAGALTCDLPFPDVVPVTLTRLDDNGNPTPRQRGTLADRGQFELSFVEAGTYDVEALFPALGAPSARGVTRLVVGENAAVHVQLHLEVP
ncbi:MAG: sigma-70 family RNA polymerase sigma factor [Planctomycetota bacterium]